MVIGGRVVDILIFLSSCKHHFKSNNCYWSFFNICWIQIFVNFVVELIFTKMQYVITHSIIWINCHKFIYVWSKLWFLPNPRTLAANIKRTIVNMSILLRLWDLRHVSTKVQASFIYSCLEIFKDKIRVIAQNKSS